MNVSGGRALHPGDISSVEHNIAGAFHPWDGKSQNKSLVDISQGHFDITTWRCNRKAIKSVYLSHSKLAV